jgi:putative endonuclease
MARNHALGRRCEDLAVAALSGAGWHILHRNFRAGPREIDLIARRGNVVAFVEVKGRSSAAHHHPLEAINPLKRRDLARAARQWIADFGQAGESYRFDAVSVLRPDSSAPEVEHLEDAWRLG